MYCYYSTLVEPTLMSVCSLNRILISRLSMTKVNLEGDALILKSLAFLEDDRRAL